MNNQAFNSKVGGIPGGVELFVAAGFVLVLENEEEYLRFPASVGTEELLVLRQVLRRLFFINHLCPYLTLLRLSDIEV